MSQYDNLLGQIVNPASGKSLQEESRLSSVTQEENKIHVIYSRDGIETKAKRELEDKMYDILMKDFPEENIFIRSTSQDTQTPKVEKVEKQKGPQKPESQAGLKVGHSSIGEKKRIPNVKKVFAVSSCKGGVGKSTVTVNLASSLSKLGFKVGIVDADIYGPSVPLLMGKKGVQPGATPEKKIKPIDAHGMKFISFGLFVGENDPVIWRGPMLGGVLKQFFFDTDWGELDFLLIDLPPGTGDIQLSMIQMAEIDGALIVSTPQKVAVDDTRKGLEMFRQLKIPVLGLVENMSYFSPDGKDEKYYIFGEKGVESMARELEVPFLGEIPLEIPLRECSDSGEPYMTKPEFEGRNVWKAYSGLAKDLSDKLLGKTQKKDGFFSKLFK